MIESTNTNELMGQTEMMDFMEMEGTRNREQGTGKADGYDADGHLINPFLQKPSPEPSPLGEGGSGLPLTEEVGEGGATATGEVVLLPDADADRLSVLATEINAITEQTRGVVISAALAVGKRLIEAKSICQEGRFGEWLEKSVSYSERKAQDMMRLYMEYGRDGFVPDSIAALDYSKAVALLSAPAEARQQLAERAVDEGLSVRQLNAEIARLKAEKAKAQMTIDAMSDRLDSQKEEIARLDDRQQTYDQAIVDRDQQLKAKAVEIEAAKDDLRVAQAKAASAEAAAEQLRRLRSEAEDRADRNDQRARDALDRANRTAKELSEARLKLARLEVEIRERETGNREQEMPEPKVVEVVPDSVTRELEDLRRQLAEAKALQKPSTGASAEAGEGGPQSGSEEVVSNTPPSGPSAADKFRWFYANQMKPAFSTALDLLKDVAAEDPNIASMFATALTRGCQALMNQLGEEVKP